jgi:hypothetical protein
MAETSLMRSAQNSMVFADMYNNMTYLLRDVPPDDEDGQRLRKQIGALTLSKRKRKQIARHFDSLVDYVFGLEELDLPATFRACLKILHRYRNAAYHRDTVRPDVLGPAVQIYFFLCCHLLKRERHIVHEINAAPPAVLEVFEGAPPETPRPGGSFASATLQNHVADRLLADLQLDHGRIAIALSEHLLARLAALDRDLTTIGEHIPPGVNRWATLRLVQQAPVEREEFDADLPEDFWTRPLPITREILDTWAVAATALRNVNVAHDALQAFAEIEEPLETLEEPVGRFIEDIDRAEQQLIDEIRGK